MHKPQKLDLVSMYMKQPVLRAHVISLQLKAVNPGHKEGKAWLDPNSCSLNLWGDRQGCTKIGFSDRAVKAIRMHTQDPLGHKRVHWSLQIEEVSDAKLHLIEYPSANLWYLAVETEQAGPQIVPLFDAALFADSAVAKVQTR